MTRNALELLKADHRMVESVMAEVRSARTASQREALVARLKAELDAHAAVEEEIFYPALRDARPAETGAMVESAYGEHDVVKTLLRELVSLSSTSGEWKAKLDILQRTVDIHVAEEERTMLPRAQRLLGAVRLRELGGEMEAHKASLEGGIGSVVTAAAETLQTTLTRGQRIMDRATGAARSALRPRPAAAAPAPGGGRKTASRPGASRKTAAAATGRAGAARKKAAATPARGAAAKKKIPATRTTAARRKTAVKTAAPRSAAAGRGRVAAAAARTTTRKAGRAAATRTTRGRGSRSR